MWLLDMLQKSQRLTLCLCLFPVFSVLFLIYYWSYRHWSNIPRLLMCPIFQIQRQRQGSSLASFSKAYCFIVQSGSGEPIVAGTWETVFKILLSPVQLTLRCTLAQGKAAPTLTSQATSQAWQPWSFLSVFYFYLSIYLTTIVYCSSWQHGTAGVWESKA